MEKPNVKVIYHPGYGFQYVRPKTETFEESHPCEHAPHKEKTMEYPEEIYAIRDGGLLVPLLRGSTSSVGWGRRNAYNIGCARGYQSGYEAGKAEQADPLAGYSNLTVAIKDNEPIDWERLDGLNAKCINPGVGIVSGKLKRRESAESDSPNGWWKSGMDYIWVNALALAWNDEDGWTLWVEGEIPLCRKTADQLEIGHLFTGRKLNGTPREYLLCTSLGEEDTLILSARNFTWTKLQAKFWEVITDHGPIQKPEGK